MSFDKLKIIWNGLSFRARLVSCLSGLFFIILTVGYWSLYVEFQTQLQNEFDRSLYNYTTDLLENVELTPGGEADLPYHVIFGVDKVFPFPHGDALVKIYRAPFFELFSYSSDKDAPINLSIVKSHIQKNQDKQFYNLTAETGKRWRGLLLQVDDSPVPEIYFFVAVPRASLTSQENKFKSIFIAGQIVILLITAFMISLLSKSILSSLEKLTGDIRHMPIGQKDFQFEVPEGPPEVSILAQVLNKLLSQVKQSLFAHQEFVAQAAHQLKTPLTIAKGHLEQYIKSQNGENILELSTVLDEINIMSGTISNLLNLVQIESGFQNINKSKFILLDHVMNDIDRYEYLAKKKGLKFQFQCFEMENSSDGWLIDTDPQLLSIILNNLYENAIKYASDSPIMIALRENSDHYVLSMTNLTKTTFIGINPKDLKEKFVRGNSPESGQGLGLYISYKIAIALNIKFDIAIVDSKFIASLIVPKVSLENVSPES